MSERQREVKQGLDEARVAPIDLDRSWQKLEDDPADQDDRPNNVHEKTEPEGEGLEERQHDGRASVDDDHDARAAIATICTEPSVATTSRTCVGSG